MRLRSMHVARWSTLLAATHRNFFGASQGPAWELVLRDSGHFQFLDSQSFLQRAVCAVGPIDDGAVRGVAQVQHCFKQIMLSSAWVSTIVCLPISSASMLVIAPLPAVDAL